MSQHLVFVYGTLRQGGLRAMPSVFPGANFIGPANVRGKLYDLGPYPGLLLDDESDSLVMGEVYQIDEEILHKLDEIEASSRYVRKQVEVSRGDDRIRCWVYEPDYRFYPQRILIASGDWIEYAVTKTEWPEVVWPDEIES